MFIVRLLWGCRSSMRFCWWYTPYLNTCWELFQNRHLCPCPMPQCLIPMSDWRFHVCRFSVRFWSFPTRFFCNIKSHTVFYNYPLYKILFLKLCWLLEIQSQLVIHLPIHNLFFFYYLFIVLIRKQLFWWSLVKLFNKSFLFYGLLILVRILSVW